jgi:agmatine deiminase
VSIDSFRMPAEWAPHDAVWTAWPHAPDQWLEGLDAPQRALMEMVAAIVDLDGSRVATRRVARARRRDEAAARRLLGLAVAGVWFRQTRYGDVWLRDTGPIFVTRAGELAAARFRRWLGRQVRDGGRSRGRGTCHGVAGVAARRRLRARGCDRGRWREPC